MNELIAFLDTHGPSLQTLSALILVLVTIIYYAYQTRSTVKEIAKQRKDNVLPFVTAESFVVNDVEIQDDFVSIAN